MEAKTEKKSITQRSNIRCEKSAVQEPGAVPKKPLRTVEVVGPAEC